MIAGRSPCGRFDLGVSGLNLKSGNLVLASAPEMSERRVRAGIAEEHGM